MQQEFTFCVDGTHRTATVTSDSLMQARADAATLLEVSRFEISWLRPLPPLKAKPAQTVSQEEAEQLNSFYSGVEA